MTSEYPLITKHSLALVSTSFSREFFDAGTVMLIDKPADWTSFDVVNKIRFATKAKRVGHAGTLDPFATGLLIVVTGKATKSVDNYSGMDKSYDAAFELGVTTDTLDVTGNILERKAVPEFSKQFLSGSCSPFIGESDQLPPAYSAIKIGGKPAYKFARKGQAIELKPRRINIHEFSVSGYEAPLLNVQISCSKGTYIRAIARDLGEKLGCGAMVKTLSRTSIGDFKLENALNLDDLFIAMPAKFIQTTQV